MIAATHIVTGAAIGAATQNPLGTVLGSFGAHYLMDMVPHWEYRIDRIRKHRNVSRKTLVDFIKIGVDIGTGTSIVLLFGWQTPFFWYALLGGFFALLPDILGGLAILMPLPFLKEHYALHERIHTKREVPNPFSGFAAQIIVTAVFLLLIVGG